MSYDISASAGAKGLCPASKDGQLDLAKATLLQT